MGFLAGLYTLLLVAICLLQALLLYRTGKPAVRQDDEALQQRLRQTDEELDNLIGVRSRAISRKLRAVQTLDENTAATLLELDTEPGRPVTARLPESGEEL